LSEILRQRSLGVYTSRVEDGSEHEVDCLIRGIVAGVSEEKGDLERVVEHVRKAEFASHRVRVASRIVGQEFQGSVLMKKEKSLLAHLAKRVLADDQWSANTSAGDYVRHLREAAADPDAKVVVYERGNRRFAGFYVPNKIPKSFLGSEADSHVWVVYDADHGKIVSGYQVESLDKVDTGKRTIWLRQ
jgi:hypothetical protein